MGVTENVTLAHRFLAIQPPNHGFFWYYSIGMPHSHQWREWLNDQEAVRFRFMKCIAKRVQIEI